jgi:phosphoserine phosphatase
VTSKKHTIALVFDFDDTLAPDSTSKVLGAIGVDTKEFWARHRELLADGWDQVPAYMHMMLEASEDQGGAITRKLIHDVGGNIDLFRGVPSLLKRCKQQIEDDEGFQAQFYVISSGLGDLIRATKIARKLTDIWGSDFAYGPSDEICAIKNVISFSDKTRYLYQISKGLVGPEARKNPFAVNQRTTVFPVPLRNMVFVGDGYTDIPCFAVVEGKGGRAVAVYEPDNPRKVGKAYGFIDDQRVSHLEPAVYVKNSGADSAIRLAITDIKDRIFREHS